MKIKKILTLIAAVMLSLSAYAEIDLKATYTDKSGQEITTSENFTEDAPLHVRFTFDPSGLPAEAFYEWHIQNKSTGTSLTRNNEEEIEFDFMEAGENVVTLQIMIDNDVVESATIIVTINESRLEMPNAFSPNGDSYNEIYRAKPPVNGSGGYQSIVDFHAYIFNRYGQKLYEWTDITGGWDGTYNGHPVKEGVYFVLVKARGADGKEYTIRRDVNLIRSFNVVDSNSSNP